MKLVAMLYARPPHAVYVLKGSGIASPKDLEGKTLADTAFSSVPKLFATYAKAAGFDASKTKWVTANNDALPGMLSAGRVDGIGQFTVGEPLLAIAAAPKEVLGLPYADAGLDSSSASSPPMKRFGQSRARSPLRPRDSGRPQGRDGQSARAGEIMHRRHPEIDLRIAIQETEKVRQLAQQPNAALGSIDPARVQKTIDVVGSAFELKSRVATADVYAPGFLPE